MTNMDQATVDGFGAEWTRFRQTDLAIGEATSIFDDYFSIFPWDSISPNAEGFDMGCGSGRWARFAAPRVGRLHCVDPSEAILVASENLSDLPNVDFYREDANSFSIEPGSQDFGYSLGVLHHVPDTELALRACVEKLKPGAPFLLYLYYSLENRPKWYKSIWRGSERLRSRISELEPRTRARITDVIALAIYLPLGRMARVIELIGFDVSRMPLAMYRNKSIYTMRTDALDRFGTRLEKRFTRDEIESMMHRCGLGAIRFRESEPYWCAVGMRV